MATAEVLEVELVELSLEVDVLDAELVVEALLAELAESALCSAWSKAKRSLLSLETEADFGGGGGGGGGPPAGGGPLPGGGPSPSASTGLAETALVLEVDAVDWLDAASSCCSARQAEMPLVAPTDPTDIAGTLHEPLTRRTEVRADRV